MVVDDDADLRIIMSQAFPKDKYRTFQAESGLAAVKLLGQHRIHLVISDIKMPDMDGIQLLKEIRKSDPRTPFVILISGFSDLTVEEAYDMGASAVMSKPFSRKTLLNRVESLLKQNGRLWSDRGARYPTNAEIQLSLTEPVSEPLTTIESHVSNLGRGGAFVGMAPPFPKVDSQVRFTIDIHHPSSLTLSGVGVVRWVREVAEGALPPGFGMEFLQLDEPGQRGLADLLDQLGDPAYIPKG